MSVRPQPPSDLPFPGLAFRVRVRGWALLWLPAADMAGRPMCPQRMRLWVGEGEPTHAQWEDISRRCCRCQEDAAGHLPKEPPAYDGTLGAVLETYRTHKHSPYLKKRYGSQCNAAYDLQILIDTIGAERILDIRWQRVLEWQDLFAKRGPSVPERLLTRLKAATEFGALLELADCDHLIQVFSRMRNKGFFLHGKKKRSSYLTYDHAASVIAEAHRRGIHSLGLAQAMQFDLGTRQKDILGEWLPIDQPGLSDVTAGGFKWLMGCRWDELDERLVLRHRLSKSVRHGVTGKTEWYDLTACPLVSSELQRLAGRYDIRRDDLPASGPMVVDEATGLPWDRARFSRLWREVARAAGIPDDVKNKDSRAGAASEARVAGASLDDVRQTLAHEDVRQTEDYSRGTMELRTQVMERRVARRQK